MGADKELKRFEKICAHINEIEPNYVKMSDTELAACALQGPTGSGWQS